jgi:hypothetical protein
MFHQFGVSPLASIVTLILGLHQYKTPVDQYGVLSPLRTLVRLRELKKIEDDYIAIAPRLRRPPLDLTPLQNSS